MSYTSDAQGFLLTILSDHSWQGFGALVPSLASFFQFAFFFFLVQCSREHGVLGNLTSVSSIQPKKSRREKIQETVARPHFPLEGEAWEIDLDMEGWEGGEEWEGGAGTVMLAFFT